ncbi:hypothetical protein [Kineosporia sp. A_224]|uniref:hypothetical protein n=1 Tax=Kineosporia sp. A_224 TaxID=1962180 RepID=UPI00117BB72A|nr:hypothetical protein [Kineosporia sp. A_224]
MTTSEVARDSWSLVPPPDVLLQRPSWVRHLASAANVLWWTTGLVAASCAGMVVAEPVLSRPFVARLLLVGGVAFLGALVSHAVSSYVTAGLVARDLEARDEAARRAWYAEPHESLPVLEAVAEELAADAAEAAADAAVRAAHLAANVAQDAAAEAAAAPDPAQVRDAARRAVEAADVAAFVVGHIPAARRPALAEGGAEGGTEPTGAVEIDLSAALRPADDWFDDDPRTGRYGYDPSYDDNVVAGDLSAAGPDDLHDGGLAPHTF